MFRATKMWQGLREGDCVDQRRIIVRQRANCSHATVSVLIELEAALPSIKLLAPGIGDPNAVGSALAVFFQ
jgi:hypothetical protein